MPLVEYGSIPFPKTTGPLSPQEEAEFKLACGKLDAINAFLQDSSAPVLRGRARIAEQTSRILSDSSATRGNAIHQSNVFRKPEIIRSFSLSPEPTPLPTPLLSTFEFLPYRFQNPVGKTKIEVDLGLSTERTTPSLSSSPSDHSCFSVVKNSYMATHIPFHCRSNLQANLDGLNINNYDLKKVLGSGNQGRVYLACHDTSLVAIKVINKRAIKNQPSLLLTYQEQRIMKSMDSPFVLSLQASFADSAYYYLVTDFCPGGDLHSLLKQRVQFDTCMARFYIAEVMLGLDYIHQSGIVHRDLKLENVLLRRDGHIVLADLGLALDLTTPDLGKPSCCGTIPYMAPEVLLRNEYSAAVDVWALGVCLYLMVTGSVPFDGQSNKEITESILKQPPLRLFERNIEQSTRSLIFSMLWKDPTSRITIIDMYIHPFFDDFDWTAAERMAVKPPYIPSDDSSLFKRDLYSYEKISPGLRTPLYDEPYPEYTWIRPSCNPLTCRGSYLAPLADSELASKYNLSLFADTLSRCASPIAGNDCLSEIFLHDPTSPRITSPAFLVSPLAMHRPHSFGVEPPTNVSSESTPEASSSTLSKLFHWLVGIGTRASSTLSHWVSRLSL